jgi:hypothetical protein
VTGTERCDSALSSWESAADILSMMTNAPRLRAWSSLRPTRCVDPRYGKHPAVRPPDVNRRPGPPGVLLPRTGRSGLGEPVRLATDGDAVRDYRAAFRRGP